MQISEVKNDHIDDDNYCHIDVYKTGNDSEVGQTVAIVCQDTGKVFFIDNAYRTNEEVNTAISEVQSLEISHIESMVQYQYAIESHNDLFEKEDEILGLFEYLPECKLEYLKNLIEEAREGCVIALKNVDLDKLK